LDRTKRLLLIGTALVGLVIFAVWLAGGGADGTPDPQPGEAASGAVGATSTSGDPSGSAVPGSASDSGTVIEEGQAEPAGTTEDSSAVTAATTEELSAEACAQFEAGDTVADFAEWFEDQFQGAEAERVEVFRAVLTRALTEECPEVVPDT
jgi:hypothetical protein